MTYQEHILYVSTNHYSQGYLETSHHQVVHQTLHETNKCFPHFKIILMLFKNKDIHQV